MYCSRHLFWLYSTWELNTALELPLALEDTSLEMLFSHQFSEDVLSRNFLVELPTKVQI